MTPHHAALRPVRYWGLLLAGALLFAALAWQVDRHGPLVFDVPILAFFAAQRQPVLDGYFFWVTWAGSKYLLVPLAMAVLAMLLRQRRYGDALLLGLGFGGAGLFTAAAKLVLARARPVLFPSVVDLPADFAFPSGHATQITAFALAVFLILRHAKPHRQWPAAGILAILVLSVAISRLYLQVHYPSDVLGGMLVGLLWVLAINGVLSGRAHR